MHTLQRLISKTPVVGALVLMTTMILASNGYAQGLKFTGYADFEAFYIDPSGDGLSNFDNHHFNIIGIGKIAKDVFVASEVEYEHSGGELGFEFGYVSYTGFKDVRIVGGKFLVPFGRFNKDLHQTWINKLVDKPNGFKEIVPAGYSDTGLWISGARALSGGNRFVYDLYTVNGLKGESGGRIRKMRPGLTEDPTEENNKAFGARLGLEAAPSGFDIGASYYKSRYAKDLDYIMYGVDAAFRRQGLEIRGEFVAATQEVDGASDNNLTGVYGQIAYRLANNIEPVVRFSTRDMAGEDKDQSRISFGASYYVSPTAAVRLNYHVNTEKSGFKADNDVIALQFTVGF